MRRNILISTTRQWNPGDEFIMMGILNIMSNIIGENFNPIIYNRNPDIRGGANFRNTTRNYRFSYSWDRKSFKGKGGLHELFRIGHYDNSWKDDMNIKNIDLAIFAGSPEWYGKRLESMYLAIEKGDIPSLFLGIGTGSEISFLQSDDMVSKVLMKSKLITVRDKETECLLKQYGAKYIPCPALLSAPTNRQVTEVKKIGLIYATNETLKGNNVSREMHDYIVKLYKEIMSKYNVGLVCHYIDEIDKARTEFPEADIYYSYDSKDYINIYNNFDLVLGGRVHGIGMAASLGIPGIMIKHDKRSSTTDGFLAETLSVGTGTNEVFEMIQKVVINVEDYSRRLIKHKEEVMKQYIELIRNTLGGGK